MLQRALLISGLIFISFQSAFAKPRPQISGVGNVLFVVEREDQSLALVDMDKMSVTGRIKLSGNMHHATMVFDPALKYGYVATRNGILTRVNLETLSEDGELKTSDNSIGLAISQDGKTIAVSEYQPGGITFVDTASFKVRQVIPAEVKKDGKTFRSRVTGLVDGPDNTFVAALMDSDQIWILGKKDPADPASNYEIKKRIKTAAPSPFDALITPEGRYYITGHLNADVASLVDLWNPADKARRLELDPHKKPGELPVKMPHMEAWAVAGDKIYVPLTGKKKLALLNSRDFSHIGSVKLIGNPVYAVVHPNHREIWVTFSGEGVDGKIQVINTTDNSTDKIINVGKRVYHLSFTPRGNLAFASSNLTNELVVINCLNHSIIKKVALHSPSGIFGVWRAFEIGL
ncbi:MAG: hypothetical protein D6719_01180 [Candidatus Dadabacteria bacterium]|nr:MAG: hypothetical protein D6719_01180 [Candidatus Dadabacteria bacterium]